MGGAGRGEWREGTERVEKRSLEGGGLREGRVEGWMEGKG